MELKTKISLLLFAFLLASCSGYGAFSANPTEIALTNAYFSEAESIIKDLEEHKLDSLPPSIYDQLSVEKVSVNDLLVIEYSAARRRIVACVTKTLVRVNSSGQPTSDPWTREFKGVYIFALQDQDWQLVNFVDTTDPEQAMQDWDFMSEEIKALSGPINDFLDKECSRDGSRNKSDLT